MNENLKVVGVQQLSSGDLKLQYSDGTMATQPLTSTTEGITSQTDLDMATANINAKIQELENKINQLDATLTKKKSAADITVSTMRAYTRLLLAKLNIISSNKETQLRITNLTELIEKKIMEDILK